MQRFRKIAIGALALGAASASAVAWQPTPGGAEPVDEPPNLIVVMTDDQALQSLRPDVFPNVLRILGDRGTTFTQSFAAPPLCCPSRAGFITGQYPHHHGVFSNPGGYESLSGKANTLPVWLREAGYRTGLVGKYLNAYTRFAGATPAPGWNYWYAINDRGVRNLPYFDTPVSDNGHRTTTGGFLTNVLNRQAIDFAAASVERDRPFFLWLAHYAPHGGVGLEDGRCSFRGPVPAPKDIGTFTDEALPRDPSFNEQNISDKPSFMRAREPLTEEEIAFIERWHQCALESLLSVDRGVRDLTRKLRGLGALDNTVMIFTDDNGYLYGDHRRKLDKSLAYENSIRVPLLIRLPERLGGDATTGGRIGRPVANIDLARTLLALADAEPCAAPDRCRVLDGRSLVPLLRGTADGFPADRGILLELGRATGRRQATAYPCTYQAIRTPDELYAEYPFVPDPETGECEASNEAELYDLGSDPFQLENMLDGPLSPAVALRRQLLAQRLDALRDCAGIEGHDPLPPSGHYCE